MREALRKVCVGGTGSRLVFRSVYVVEYRDLLWIVFLE